MQIKLKQADVLEFAAIVRITESQLPPGMEIDSRLMYWLGWTEQKLSSEERPISKAVSSIEGWEDFVKRREELFKEIGKRDVNNPKFITLREEYAATIKKYEELISEEIEIDLRPLKPEIVPSNSLFYPLMKKALAIFGMPDEPNDGLGDGQLKDQ